MSERKVLNKYYPPDFDPSKIPRMKCAKNRQFTVRLMAPFNMRCATCGEYIYKGKKFNAKKEDVEGQDYLGIRIFRFYIKCTRCLQEISFKTDPRNTDYEIEAGATRNFMALKLAEEQAEREEEERREEEASNPMKLLENRTQQSKNELDILESLEELKDLNKRQQNIDYETLLSQYNSREAQERIRKMQEEDDERFVKSVFGKKTVLKEEIVNAPKKKKRKSQPADDGEASTSSSLENQASLMVTKAEPLKVNPIVNKSIGAMRRPLTGLVKKKTTAAEEMPPPVLPPPKNPAEEKGVSEPAAHSEPIPEKKVNALSMLGSYSGSDSDSS